MAGNNTDAKQMAADLVDDVVRDLQNLDWTDGENPFNLNDYVDALVSDAEISMEQAAEVVDEALDILTLQEVEEPIDKTSPCFDDDDSQT